MHSKTMKLSDYGFTVLQIETKSNCNMACRFCPYPIRDDNKSVMKDEDVFKLIDQIDPFDTKFEYVCFSQFNEPLLDGNIFKYIKYANSKKIKNLLITNAMLLNNENRRKKIIEAAPSVLKISLHTLNKEKFNWSRGTNLDVDDYFLRIYKLLSEIKGSSTIVNVDLACNFMSKKKKTIKKFLGLSTGEASVPENVSEIIEDLKNFLKGLSSYDNSFNIDKKQIEDFLLNSSPDYMSEEGLKIAPNIYLKVKAFIHGRRISDFKPLIHSFSCKERILGVLADGSLMPCCKTYNNDLSLGNTKTNKMIDILNDNKKWITNLRAVTKEKSKICKKCYGEPTNRGVYSRALIDKIKSFNSIFKLKIN